ncbi:DsrE family protein [Imperialibacter roseus]|uniref:DsrE family protein n=1 Tax=Imperialibacter roseus TaxID=1324217 RepID=A0ABZ0IHI1_9BACT|nr:DsrE family protein [Imperialibacter roseus]WOK04488.1 DsrE family protein [Imperialibacter roseus]
MEHRIVIQVEHYGSGLTARLADMQADLGAANIEVVLHGEAVRALIGDVQLPLVNSIIACQRALRSQQIDPEQLPAGVQVVPSGLAQIVRRQTEGWAYLKL